MGITVLIADYITILIEKTGYLTVFLGMIMESMVFPVPSEAIMPFAGFLVAEGKFTFFGVVTLSTFASLIGSLASYYIGYYGGQPFINKFGKYFLINQEELEFTKKFFQKRGPLTIFICRFIPVVRHLISLPAGIARMNIWKFSLLTLIGAGLWNSFLTILGYRLRQNWQKVIEYGETVDHVMVILILLFIAFYIYRYFKKRKISKK